MAEGKELQLCLENTTRVCYTNISFMLFLFIVTAFPNVSNCCQVEATVIQYSLIVCATLFNLTVLYDPSRKGEPIPRSVTDMVETCISRAKKMVAFYLLEIRDFVAERLCQASSIPLNSPSKIGSTGKSEEGNLSKGSTIAIEDLKDTFQEPAETQNFNPAPEIAKHNAPSKPADKITVNQRMNYQDVINNLQLKTPELFQEQDI